MKRPAIPPAIAARAEALGLQVLAADRLPQTSQWVVTTARGVVVVDERGERVERTGLLGHVVPRAAWWTEVANG